MREASQGWIDGGEGQDKKVVVVVVVKVFKREIREKGSARFSRYARWYKHFTRGINIEAWNGKKMEPNIKTGIMFITASHELGKYTLLFME